MLLAKLTKREQQIAELISAAKSNKEIAYAIGIGEGAVKQYIYKLFKKLKIYSRTELAVLCLAPQVPAAQADPSSWVTH